MQDLSVGILQFDQIWQDKTANFERIVALLAAQPQIDLLLLPEMFHTGFSMNIELADNWSDAEGIHFLKQLVQQRAMAIYTSLMVKDQESYYNRGVFIAPNGEVTCYDKQKAFGLGGEDQYFITGKSETIVSY